MTSRKVVIGFASAMLLAMAFVPAVFAQQGDRLMAIRGCPEGVRPYEARGPQADGRNGEWAQRTPFPRNLRLFGHD